jgi:hypothetical protein
MVDYSIIIIYKIVTNQVDRLKTVRKKRILKPCLVQESDVSAKSTAIVLF